MSEWLDLELSHHLARVPAPEALWDRIQRDQIQSRAADTACSQDFGPAPRRVTPRAFRQVLTAAWPVAAILSLMAAAGTLWLVAKGEQPALDLRQLAIEQLRNRQPLGLDSSDPGQVSAWMRQAGIDVTLPSTQSAKVKLAGARLLRKHGVRIGAIAFRIGEDNATLLIARAGDASETGHGLPFWSTRSQSYALVSTNPDHLEAACLLCHPSL